MNGSLCSTVGDARRGALAASSCNEMGIAVGLGGLAPFPVPGGLALFPVPRVRPPPAVWIEGFGVGVPRGHTMPALVTAQFDAQVTPVADTTHAGLPGQVSPALVRKQPGLGVPEAGAPAGVVVVVEDAVVVAGAVVVAVEDVVVVAVEDVVVVAVEEVVGADVVVVVADVVVVGEVVVVLAEVVVVSLADVVSVLDEVAPLEDGPPPRFH